MRGVREERKHPCKITTQIQVIAKITNIMNNEFNVKHEAPESTFGCSPLYAARHGCMNSTGIFAILF